MEKRQGIYKRESSETTIEVHINIDGKGNTDIHTGIGFFDHMLTLFAVHGGFDLQMNCQGDLHIDAHHTVEDSGIVLGKAFSSALSDKKGIYRYGTVFLPMDETLVMVSLDISGRPYLYYDVSGMNSTVGNFDTELIQEFFRAFSIHSGMTLHIRKLYGMNTHHIIEGIFKAFARSLKQAVMKDDKREGIPSSKGIID